MTVLVSGIIPAGKSRAWVKKVAREAQEATKMAGDLAVVFVDSRRIAEINSRYRGHHEPTDILSFESGEEDDLGDIFICERAARVKAKARDEQFVDYLARLIVHGTLHLCGFDHLRPSEAERMECLEEKVLKNLQK